MARPRVFVSSTYYDLKHVRASLENFIESLGFDAVLSERGDIPFMQGRPLDQSCYREVGNADILVLLIGGRYGTEVTSDKSEKFREFYDRHESITKTEYEKAIERGIPVYVLIERAVHNEYLTFLKNPRNTSISYAHVDSINVFHFIFEVLRQKPDSPVHDFDRYSDIEGWLREQWAGLFRDFLSLKSEQAQIASLAEQVSELQNLGKSMTRYLEEVMTKVSPADAAKIISDETERRERANRQVIVAGNNLPKFLQHQLAATSQDIDREILAATDASDLIERLSGRVCEDYRAKVREDLAGLFSTDAARIDCNRLRHSIDLPPLFPEVANNTVPRP